MDQSLSLIRTDERTAEKSQLLQLLIMTVSNFQVRSLHPLLFGLQQFFLFLSAASEILVHVEVVHVPRSVHVGNPVLTLAESILYTAVSLGREETTSKPSAT